MIPTYIEWLFNKDNCSFQMKPYNVYVFLNKAGYWRSTILEANYTTARQAKKDTERRLIGIL